MLTEWVNEKQHLCSIELPTFPSIFVIPLGFAQSRTVREQFRGFSWKLKENRWEPKRRIMAKIRALDQKDALSIGVKSPRPWHRSPETITMMSPVCIFKTVNHCRNTARGGEGSAVESNEVGPKQRAHIERPRRMSRVCACGCGGKLVQAAEALRPWKT